MELGCWPALPWGKAGGVTKSIPPSGVWLEGEDAVGGVLQSSSEFGFYQRGVGIRVGTSMAALPMELALALHWGPLVLEKCPLSPVTCRLSQIALLWVELCVMLQGSFFLSLLTGITVMYVTVW